MMEKMKEQKIPWPEFNGSEMADLITYLNSKLIPRIAEIPLRFQGGVPER
jgi:hypothetical protein